MKSSQGPHPGWEQQAEWNEAHARLTDYFSGFRLRDQSQVSRLSLHILALARKESGSAPGVHPTTLCLTIAQREYQNWLALNLSDDGTGTQSFLPGSLGILLSGVFWTAPDAFLTQTLPEEVKLKLRQSLLVNGPELNISSMTPRHIDYGPMLGIAKQTWHRWDLPYLLVAVVFWLGVYSVMYYWLSDYL